MNNKFFVYALCVTIVVTIGSWVNMFRAAGNAGSSGGSSWSSSGHGGYYGGSGYSGGGGGHK